MEFRYVSKKDKSERGERWREGCDEHTVKKQRTSEARSSQADGHDEKPAQETPALETPVKPAAKPDQQRPSGKSTTASATSRTKGKAKAKAQQPQTTAATVKAEQKKAEEFLNRYNTTRAQTTAVIAKVTGGEKPWCQLQSLEQFKELQSAYDELDSNAQQDEFFKGVLMHGFEDVKQGMDQDEYLSNLKKTSQHAQGLGKLKVQNERILKLRALL